MSWPTARTVPAVGLAKLRRPGGYGPGRQSRYWACGSFSTSTMTCRSRIRPQQQVYIGNFVIGPLLEWMTMEPEVAGVIRIFNSLSTKLQEESAQTLNEYFSADSQRRQQLINESEPRRMTKKVNLGPVNGVCPYCGR